MTIKSLLLTTVAAGACLTASAFPTITTSPSPGTYDNVYNLANIQLQSSGNFTIVENPAVLPYFENWDTGDMIQTIEFYDQDFMGMTLHHVKFNESDFSDNGEWVLTIPAGCLIDTAGDLNETLEFHYTLNDPNVGIGDFPQITLLSSDPADGATLPYWGEYLGRVSFVTDNDDAVNYIGWTLYDVTNGTAENEREWLRQGNENRFDVNRTFGDASDQWADGLYINVGGSNEKLLQGHTYRLYLEFCGIGYDIETNQYPTSQQLQKSLELETYLEFHGQIPGTEYSPWVVESISPDPSVYEFDNIDLRTFTVFYSGYVKPTMFDYPLGMGAGTAPAGTFAPATDANVDGYAEAWDFTFDASVLKQTLGEIMVTIQASDEDGLPVKGNSGYSTDDFSYKITWTCNLGAVSLTSISPENGATVEELSSITIGNEKGQEMNLSYTTSERPTLVSNGRMIAIDLDEPEFSEDGKTATWTFDPIKTSGTYQLTIPKNYFNIGTEFEGTSSNKTTFSYVVEGEEEVGNVELDLIPASSSIEDGANVEEGVSEIVLTFADVTFMDFEPMPEGSLYKESDSMFGNGEYVLVESINPVDNDFFAPTEYTFYFSTPINESGRYRFVVPAKSFYDEAYSMSAGENGHANPELVYNFTVGIVGVEAILSENGTANVYDLMGRVVVRNANKDQLKGLDAGIYVIDGKKFVVK